MCHRRLEWFCKTSFYAAMICVFVTSTDLQNACVEEKARQGSNVTFDAIRYSGKNQSTYWFRGSRYNADMMCNFTGNLTVHSTEIRLNYTCQRNFSLTLINVTSEYSNKYYTRTTVRSTSTNSWSFDTCFKLTVTIVKPPKPKRTTTLKRPQEPVTKPKTTYVDRYYDGFGATIAVSPGIVSSQRQSATTISIWICLISIVVIVVILFYFRIPQKLLLPFMCPRPKDETLMIPQTEL
ncbi:membrane glycoprotein UL11 [Panine betaherpesvirus 2]|uniref:Membrane glycoprotein UL11 n=1 Tax=Panine betaherpesvirus 2 TaxID=188763 RepID=Q8QS75_9BETA|nr:membrane glycoprotein UL11 [Panine betaherpesvirus 2]AAM00662.1 membrane glycoprotein UL11 [Panine betaherpesvirus 2]QXV67764.1 membrane glycoprotein UL11 [Panine betaherpesvirus 2]